MSKEKPISNRLHLASLIMTSMLSNTETIKSVKGVAEGRGISYEETLAIVSFVYADELIKQESLTLQK